MITRSRLFEPGTEASITRDPPILKKNETYGEPAIVDECRLLQMVREFYISFSIEAWATKKRRTECESETIGLAILGNLETV